MARSSHLAYLALALPFALHLACSDDAGSDGSSSSASGTTTAGATTGAGSTTGSGTTTSSAGGAGSTSTGGGSTSVTTTATGGGNGGAGGQGGTGGTTYSTGSTTPTEIVQCQGKTYQCGDLIDNDGDGLLDSEDPDCLGPCDNTEDSFAIGIPGGDGPACAVDCYFDQDSGSGNDQCRWDHRCDPLSVDPNYYPEPWNGDACAYEGDDVSWFPAQVTCAEYKDGQSQECYDFCRPLVPNGCDCFGCCELPAGTGKFVFLGSEGVDPGNPTVCTLDQVENPDVCHPCTPVPGCYNDCGVCELCIGKSIDDIPPECYGGEGGSGSTTASTSSSSTGGGDGGAGTTSSTSATTGSTTSSGVGGGTQCPAGVQACGLPGQALCPTNYYCLTGCCTTVPN